MNAGAGSGKSIVDIRIRDGGKVAGYVSGKLSVAKKGTELSVVLGWGVRRGLEKRVIREGGMTQDEAQRREW